MASGAFLTDTIAGRDTLINFSYSEAELAEIKPGSKQSNALQLTAATNATGANAQASSGRWIADSLHVALLLLLAQARSEAYDC